MAAFTITTPSGQVRLDSDRHVRVPFTVANDSGLALDVQAQATPRDGAGADWFSVVAPAIVHLEPGGRATYQVEVRVPGSAPAGEYQFSLVASDVLDPEDRYADGPPVSFEVGAAPPPPKPVITDAGYVATFLGAFAGDIIILLITIAVAAAILFATERIPSSGNFVGDIVAIFVVGIILGFIAALIGILLGGPLGAGLGAFIGLRVRGHQASGWSGLAVGLIQLFFTPVGIFLGALTTHLPKPIAGVLITLLVIVTILLPAMAGRGLVLLFRHQFVWPWVDIFGRRPT